MNREAFTSGVESLEILLSNDQMTLFERFEEALYEANRVMNLTRVNRAECWQRHFLDSLLISEFIPRGSKVLDVGTGPGFPAWPLACARPDLLVTALDSSNKMISFLSSLPLPNLVALLGRGETLVSRATFDFVTGRALAPLPIQLELSAPACKIGGQVVPMRTPAEREIFESSNAAELGLELADIQERTLPGSDIVRAFPIFKKVKPTPKRFPRAWAEIKAGHRG